VSQSLHFWTFPLPRTAAEAQQIHERLSAETRKHNVIFRRLATQFTERYPCITTLDADDSRAVWSDGPLDGVTDNAVFSVGIRTEHLAEVIPFVVEVATSLGLVTHEPLNGTTWLPGGLVLEGDASRVGQHLGLDLRGPLDKALITRTVNDALHPLLAELGFESSRTAGVLRTYAEGSQLLRISWLEPTDEGMGFDVDIILHHNSTRELIERLLKAAGLVQEKYIATAMGSMATLARFFRVRCEQIHMEGTSRPRYRVKTADDLREAIIGMRHLTDLHLRAQLVSWEEWREIAFAVLRQDFEYHKIIGSALVQDGDRLVKSTYGANMLSTERCGGDLPMLVLAVLAEAPHLTSLVQKAEAGISRLPLDRQQLERAKLDAFKTAFCE
jgi:hypothetical protein